MFAETNAECAKEGWEVLPDGDRTVKPTARATSAAFPATTPDYLQKMASHIAFLERKSQG